MSIEKLNNMLVECVDNKGLVFFEWSSRVDTNIVECDALLDLQAGADDDFDDGDVVIDDIPDQLDHAESNADFCIEQIHDPDDDAVIHITSYFKQLIVS